MYYINFKQRNFNFFLFIHLYLQNNRAIASSATRICNNNPYIILQIFFIIRDITIPYEISQKRNINKIKTLYIL